MIQIDDLVGCIEVWMESADGRWLLLASGATQLAALIDAERVIRDELSDLQALLHAARQAERSMKS